MQGSQCRLSLYQHVLDWTLQTTTKTLIARELKLQRIVPARFTAPIDSASSTGHLKWFLPFLLHPFRANSNGHQPIFKL